MTDLSTPLVITPALRRYAWGDPDFIPRLFGSAPTGEPIAEAWLGAHPIAPAHVVVGGRERALDRVIAEHPAILGPDVSARFGELPYLLKILAAAKPLSIQVHPDAAQAAEGFAREEALGIPRDAPSRCYRDPHAKPEVIVALTPFDALAGFRPHGEIARALDALPELRGLLPRYEGTSEGLRALLEAYFAVPDDALRPALERTIARIVRSGVRPIAGCSSCFSSRGSTSSRERASSSRPAFRTRTSTARESS
jgi:mannose-6-phosphate isomerase class I